MASFHYKARAANGNLVAGLLVADSLDQAAQRLNATGVWPIDITQAGDTQDASLQRLIRRLGMGRVQITDLVLFSRQMYTIVKAGIPLLRGMRGLVSSTHNPALRETLEDVLANLEGGRDLAASLARHPQIFPSLFVSLVKVGEATGTLEQSFLRLTEHLAQEKAMRDRVKSAVRYPMIVVITIVLAALFLASFVIPKFEPIFRALQGDIPLPTQVIMGVSVLTREYWHVSLGVIALLVIGLRSYVRTADGRMLWDRLKLKLPVMSAGCPVSWSMTITLLWAAECSASANTAIPAAAKDCIAAESIESI